MRWSSALSEKPDALEALAECAEAAAGEGRPDLALLFASAHHAPAYPALAAGMAKAVAPRHWLGCSAGGVIGGGREVEHRAALALVCAWLPKVSLRLFAVEQEGMPDPDSPPKKWRQWAGLPEESARDAAAFILLSDPFSLNPEDMLAGLDFAFPAAAKVGGLVSGGRRPGECALFLDGALRRAGAVGAALSGDVALEPIVAQGCRPIGKDLRVTRCERNVLIELEGAPALRALAAVIDELPPDDQALARNSLFVGLRSDPLKENAGQGDYLIRNLLGADHQRGLLSVGAMIRPGQLVRFHLRDREASTQDLEERLKAYAALKGRGRPAGALLFSCLGRGEHLFGKPGHDSDLFLRRVADVPVGGFFCNGEIGPVGKATYLHGYTSCFGVFRPRG